MRASQNLDLFNHEVEIEERTDIKMSLPTALARAVWEEKEKRQLTFRQVAEWSFGAFITRSNPDVARELGIVR